MRNDNIIVTFQLHMLYARTRPSHSLCSFHAAKSAQFVWRSFLPDSERSPQQKRIEIKNEESHLWYFRRRHAKPPTKPKNSNRISHRCSLKCVRHKANVNTRFNSQTKFSGRVVGCERRDPPHLFMWIRMARWMRCIDVAQLYSHFLLSWSDRSGKEGKYWKIK